MSNAIVVHQTGGPEVLTIEDQPARQPQAGQVSIDVAAVGVNFIDIYHRSGVYKESLPFVPGSEGAGRITAVGVGVTDFAVGDRVAWSGIGGSYAASVVGSAESLIPVPDGIDDQTAAALPLQGLTAHYLATASYPIQAGDDVLIHAGAGGVGLLLTQIAKILGARVITTVSSAQKAALSKAAGADDVLTGYDDFASKVRELTGGAGVAAVYDGVGKDTFDASLAALRRRGSMVLFGGSSGQVPPFDLQRLNAGGSLSVTRPKLGDFTATRAELLARAADLFGWIGEGRLDVRIGGTYPLTEAARAHDDLANRRTTAKLLLIP